MMASERLENALKELEEKKRSGDIDTVGFYKGLLDVIDILREELSKENLSEAQVKKQVPFILAFIKTQIKELKNRGN